MLEMEKCPVMLTMLEVPVDEKTKRPDPSTSKLPPTVNVFDDAVSKIRSVRVAPPVLLTVKFPSTVVNAPPNEMKVAAPPEPTKLGQFHVK
ncbi:MAG: hypothetical protein JNL17_01395 [Cyclobacteriaceae bacterium]|nr:hypothetical protein [Cyclobacteriaceae bacterium]